jgi:hypothetical protein
MKQVAFYVKVLLLCLIYKRYIRTIYTYVQGALQTKRTDMTKSVTVQTIFHIRLQVTQFYSLGQPTMMGFLAWFFLLYPRDYGLSTMFTVPKACSELSCMALHGTPSYYSYTRWLKYDRDWFVCKQAALRSSRATLRGWSHNLHPPSCSG